MANEPERGMDAPSSAQFRALANGFVVDINPNRRPRTERYCMLLKARSHPPSLEDTYWRLDWCSIGLQASDKPCLANGDNARERR